MFNLAMQFNSSTKAELTTSARMTQNECWQPLNFKIMNIETFITHHSERFYENLYISYCSVLTAAESVALLHIDTKERNNPYHWKHYVDDTNKVIVKLRNMLPEWDKRRENFKLLNAEDYEKKAVKFFEADFY